jgi:fatty acid desaturase
MENYYEHFGATPENSFANSVSHYGRIYNLVFFNEGYHQEHHLRPQAHWTKRPHVHEEFKEALRQSDRHVSAFPPLLGFLERRPQPTKVRQA